MYQRVYLFAPFPCMVTRIGIARRLFMGHVQMMGAEKICACSLHDKRVEGLVLQGAATNES